MKNHRKPLLRPSAALLPLLVCVVSTYGQTPTPPAPATSNTGTASAASSSNEETVELPAFQVTTSAADPYHQADVTSVARIAGAVLDAPFSVNVVSPQLISDLGANAGYDVDRYFAGMSAGRGAGAEGIMDRQDFRGFESFSKTIDDFSAFDLPSASGFQANFDIAFVDRQELVMGPDSILSPTGTPGGSVNIITKTPQFTESTDLTGTFGNYDAGRYSLDTTGPIGDKLAYRVIGSFQDASNYIPGTIKQENIGLMATYKFTEQSKVTFKYFGEDWGEFGEAANANDWGEMVYTPDTIQRAEISTAPQPGFSYTGWNGSATWSRRRDRLNIAELELTTPIFNVVNMRLAGQILTDHFNQDSAYPSISPSDSAWDASGNVTKVTPGFTSLTSIPVVGQYANSYWRGFQLQNDYAANFHPGPISLQPVVGWAYQQGHAVYSYSAQDNNPVDLPNVNLLTNNGAQIVGSTEHPPLADYTHSPTNQPAFGIQKQTYGLIKAGAYDDRVLVVGGASRTWVDIDNYKSSTTIPNGTALPKFTGPYSRTVLDSQQDTYLAGAILKPTENTSLYYTFSSNAAVTTSPSNTPLWQTGKQHEFGFKTEFFDQRLSINADHFQITEFNLASPNPLFNIDTSQPQTLLGNATSKGYELNVVGGITKNLSIVASLTSMKYRDFVGRRVRNVPDHLANLLIDYHFTDGLLKGANVFAGVVHSGDVAGETVTASTTAANVTAGNAPAAGIPEQPGFFVPAWTVVNAGAGYTWDRYHIGLNLDNLANSHFFWDPAGRNSVPVYSGLTVRVTLSIHI
jgi:iron complex outermembrane receptor protein